MSATEPKARALISFRDFSRKAFWWWIIIILCVIICYILDSRSSIADLVMLIRESRINVKKVKKAKKKYRYKIPAKYIKEGKILKIKTKSGDTLKWKLK